MGSSSPPLPPLPASATGDAPFLLPAAPTPYPSPIGFGDYLNGSRSPSTARFPGPTRWLRTPSPLCALTPGSAASLRPEAPGARGRGRREIGHLGRG